jgi:hypothetical protein
MSVLHFQIYSIKQYCSCIFQMSALQFMIQIKLFINSSSFQVTQVSTNKEVWDASEVNVNFQTTEQLNSNMMYLLQIIVCYRRM